MRVVRASVALTPRSGFGRRAGTEPFPFVFGGRAGSCEGGRASARVVGLATISSPSLYCGDCCAFDSFTVIFGRKGGACCCVMRWQTRPCKECCEIVAPDVAQSQFEHAHLQRAQVHQRDAKIQAQIEDRNAETILRRRHNPCTFAFFGPFFETDVASSTQSNFILRRRNESKKRLECTCTKRERAKPLCGTPRQQRVRLLAWGVGWNLPKPAWSEVPLDAIKRYSESRSVSSRREAMKLPRCEKKGSRY